MQNGNKAVIHLTLIWKFLDGFGMTEIKPVACPTDATIRLQKGRKILTN